MARWCDQREYHKVHLSMDRRGRRPLRRHPITEVIGRLKGRARPQDKEAWNADAMRAEARYKCHVNGVRS